MTAMGDVTEDDLYEAFKEQAIALAKGGADALCIETMSAIDEATAAVRPPKQAPDVKSFVPLLLKKMSKENTGL